MRFHSITVQSPAPTTNCGSSARPALTGQKCPSPCFLPVSPTLLSSHRARLPMLAATPPLLFCLLLLVLQPLYRIAGGSHGVARCRSALSQRLLEVAVLDAATVNAQLHQVVGGPECAPEHHLAPSAVLGIRHHELHYL